jgi:biotin operon repressor
MSKAASNFRRTDVKRAIQAVESAGLKVERVELKGGKIILFPEKSDKPSGDESSEDIKL